MAARVVVEPAILARTKSEFLSLLTQARALSAAFHVDLMDGTMTKHRTISPSVVASTKLGPKATVHLMVKDPIAWLPAVVRSGAKQAIIHVEIGPRAAISIAAYRAAGLRVGIALKMPTNVRLLNTYRRVPWVHLMTGSIGQYGSPFSRQAVERIVAVKKAWPRSLISVDVGMNPKTIPLVVAAGARRIIVGSYIWSGEPQERWAELKALVKTL